MPAMTDGDRRDFEVVVKGLFAAGGGSKIKPTANVLHYRRTNFTSPYSGTDFITAWLTANKANWKALVNLQWTMDKITIRCINDPTEGITEVTVNEAGTVTGDCLPNYAAIVFSKKTAKRGKSYRGRLYVAGVGEDDNANNALTNGAKTRADTLATSLLAGVTDGSGVVYKLSIASVKNITPNSSPIEWNQEDVTALIARKQIGRMGSRSAPVLS